MLMHHEAGPTEDRRIYVTGYLIDDIERFLSNQLLKCEIDFKRANKMTTILNEYET